MRSKSESGIELDRMNWDVGVANKIFMDNSTKQTGYNTEMKIVVRLSIMDVQTTGPYSAWKNKAESGIKIIKGKSKRGIF